jgi:hypothetical protein
MSLAHHTTMRFLGRGFFARRQFNLPGPTGSIGSMLMLFQCVPFLRIAWLAGFVVPTNFGNRLGQFRVKL